MAEPIFTVIDDGTPIDVGLRDGAERVRRAQEGGRPVALDEAERVAYLGVSAEERGRRLASLEAPEFTLPDLDGGRPEMNCTSAGPPKTTLPSPFMHLVAPTARVAARCAIMVSTTRLWPLRGE